MDLKKKIAILTTVSVLSVTAIGTTLALFTDRGQVTNVFTMGSVGITLTEPIFSVNTEGGYTIEDVVPNQVIIKDPLVTVEDDSEDVYVRVEVTITGDLTDIEKEQLLANISLNQGTVATPDDVAIGSTESVWFLSDDGYYYYRPDISDETVGILSAGEERYVFDKVRIPETWSNEIAGKEFQISIKAYAVQSSNFVPGENTLGVYGWFESDGEALIFS